MTIHISLGLENALLTTLGLGAVMNYGVIEIYSGTQPYAAEDPPTGDLLAYITQNGDPFQVNSSDTGSGGLQLQMSSDGSGLRDVPGWRLKGVSEGQAGWWRWKWNSPDDNTGSISLPRIDGAVGESLALRVLAITPQSDILIESFLVQFSSCVE